MPDVVTGSRDAVRDARRMITGLEKQAGLLRGSAWALVTGRTELLRQWEQWWDSTGRQPRGQEKLLRSMAQMLERWVETLRMMA